MLTTDTATRVVRFTVRHEPIWQFNDHVALADAADHPDLIMPGDSAVVPCNDGVLIYLAVEDFDEFPMALANDGHVWFRMAVEALKSHIYRQAPNSVLSVYRSPIDGELGNLAG